jgi:hypothetical protein
MDEVDSIGSARTDNSGGGGDSEVQRTMLELLNQLDGFEATNKIKVWRMGDEWQVQIGQMGCVAGADRADGVWADSRRRPALPPHTHSPPYPSPRKNTPTTKLHIMRLTLNSHSCPPCSQPTHAYAL